MHWEAGTSQEGNSSVTQGPQSRWDIGSWDNPQWLPVPPDTALGTLRLVTGQAAGSGWGSPPAKAARTQCLGRIGVPTAPGSQPTLTGERAVRATVHHHQYAYRLPSAPPLQPICDHTWLRRRGSCRGGGGGGEDPPAPSQHGHAAQPGAGAVPL